MAKLSDVFLHLLGNAAKGVYGMTPPGMMEENRRRAATGESQQQQLLDSQRLTSLAHFANAIDTGSTPFDVPGIGQIPLTQRPQSFIPITQDSSGNSTFGSPVNVPHGAKPIVGKSPTINQGKPVLKEVPGTGELAWFQPPGSGGAVTPVAQGITKAQGEANENDVLSKSVLGEIDRIDKLNDNSYGGILGAGIMKGKSALNMGKDDPKFQNSADVINTLQGQVSRILKSTFGGQLSDSEREYLNGVYGAIPSMSQTERKIAMKNVKTIITGKAEASRAKAGIRGGATPAPTLGGDPLGIL